MHGFFCAYERLSKKEKSSFRKRKTCCRLLYGSFSHLNFVPINHSGFFIMGYGKYVRNIPRCLECGDKISYGRTDKKFCCEECRMKYHYSSRKTSGSLRRKILAMLSRNYSILEELVDSERESVDLVELASMGFVPGIVTSYRRIGKHDVYCCFDIKYIMTRTRIYSLMKIQNLSVNLQVGTEKED